MKNTKHFILKQPNHIDEWCFGVNGTFNISEVKKLAFTLSIIIPFYSQTQIIESHNSKNISTIIYYSKHINFKK